MDKKEVIIFLFHVKVRALLKSLTEFSFQFENFKEYFGYRYHEKDQKVELTSRINFSHNEDLSHCDFQPSSKTLEVNSPQYLAIAYVVCKVMNLYSKYVDEETVENFVYELFDHVSIPYELTTTDEVLSFIKKLLISAEVLTGSITSEEV